MSASTSDDFFEIAEFLFDREAWNDRYQPFVRVRRAAYLQTQKLLLERQGYTFEPPFAEAEPCLIK